MSLRALLKFGGITAILAGLSSIAFGVLFLFVVPDAQKGAAPAALTSFATNPTAAQVVIALTLFGALCTLPAIVGIYYRLSEKDRGWAAVSLILGGAFSILTAVDAAYTGFLFPLMSNLYATGDPTIKASAVVAWNMPSPVNPYDFSEFFLAGLWLLVTGWLIVRSGYFAPVSGYIALIGGIGLIVLFIGTVTGTEPLILATGAPGALIVAPVFWLWIGYTLWTKS